MCRICERLRAAATALGLAVALAWPPGIRGQDDLTRPPRLDEAPAPPQRTAAPAAPTAVEVEAQAEEIEEILVVSDQNPWRLPDLGSSWRAQHTEVAEQGRIRVEALPLWNPDTEEVPTSNPFAVADDIRRVGFIEVFRVRFGGR